MSETESQSLEYYTITEIADSRGIPRDRVINVIKTRRIPHVKKMGAAKIYSLPQRKLIEAELDRIEQERK